MDNKIINLNETLVSGEITNVFDNDNQFINFGIKTERMTSNNTKYTIYLNLQIHRDLYSKYKDFFVKEKFVYVKGYLNSYKDKNNKYVSFITVYELSDNYEQIVNGRKGPVIRYDDDGVMVWDGKRCESKLPTSEEIKEMEDILSEFE